ncbi:hypothetical protein P4O66_001001 [Electrophorus voltai]|uniref:SPRY-associated domain-containing protein n=1 Tax=Electrophorus voltai TaxID=2609070 RepID=A0AAD8ZCN2_9TELE|nr:hypothetical protein P4O66_001001 [Electrophorus voltai]
MYYSEALKPDTYSSFVTYEGFGPFSHRKLPSGGWVSAFLTLAMSLNTEHLVLLGTPEAGVINKEVLSMYNSCEFTLDPNTAQDNIYLPKENRVATCNETVQSYPDHPERFDN